MLLVGIWIFIKNNCTPVRTIQMRSSYEGISGGKIFESCYWKVEVTEEYSVVFFSLPLEQKNSYTFSNFLCTMHKLHSLSYTFKKILHLQFCTKRSKIFVAKAIHVLCVPCFFFFFFFCCVCFDFWIERLKNPK